MTKTKIYLFILLIIISGTFTVSAENYDDALKVKINKRALTLNPIYSFNSTEKTINKQIFDNLLVFNSQGEVINNLTESWEINDDSTIFRFNLKKDIYFHPYKINGKEIPIEQRKVTASDWKWSFEYLTDPKNKSSYAENFQKVMGYDDYRQQKTNEISGIKVINDYQLEIELKNSYAPFIYNLMKEAAVVMPKQAVLNSEQKFSLAPVGTGAFKLKKFSNKKIVLIKNKNYWKNNNHQIKLPYLNQIEFYFNNDNNLNENYQNFDLYQLNHDQIIEYYHKKNNINNEYSLNKIVDNNICFTAFNYKNNLNNNLNCKEVKEKIRSILKEIHFIESFKLNNFSYLENKNDNLRLLNKINSINQQSSVKNFNTAENPSLNIAVNDSDLSLKTAELIKKELKSLNINLKIKNYSWTDYLNILKNNLNSELFIMSYNYENKFDFIADNFYSESENNYFNYENRRVDNLIDYIKLTKNKNNQDIAYNIIEEILLTDNPFIFIFQAADNYLISNQLSNQELFKNIYTRNNFELLYFKQ
jgi:peptide/nickel transport system substrate-binding protein